MPRRRVPTTQRQTPAAKALRRAVDEEMAAMIRRCTPSGKTKAQRARDEAKASQRFKRGLDKGRAKWDQKPQVWKAKQGAKILANSRRYDRAASLPLDGGRELFALGYGVDRLLQKGKRESTGDGYALHRQQSPSAGPRKPLPAIEAAESPSEPPAKKRSRKRARAGYVGYIDPRLFDDDDWED